MRHRANSARASKEKVPGAHVPGSNRERLPVWKTIVIAPDGTLQFVYDDALRGLLDLGEAEITRASHIEPRGTRWTIDFAPIAAALPPAFPREFGQFSTRGEALVHEHAFVEQLLTEGKL